MRTLTGLLLLGLLVAGTGRRAAAADAEARTEMVTLNEMFNGIYLYDRIEAYRRVGNLGDRETLAEFSFVQRLLERARDRDRPAGERSAALSALVALSMKQMVNPQEMIDYLYAIITSARNSLSVRLDALGLLRRFGRVDADNDLSLEQTIRRTHDLVAEIASRPSDPEDNPLRLRIEAVKTLGALAPRDAMDVFKRLLRTADSEALRAAAIEGIFYYVRTRREEDPVLLEDLTELAAEAEGAANRRLREVSLICIDALVKAGTEPRNDRELMRLLLNRFHEGSDTEMMITGRTLLRLADAETLPRVIEAHVEELRSGTRGVEAQAALLKGFIEFYAPLGAIAGDDRASRVQQRQALESAETSTNFLVAVLKRPEAPLRLRLICARGLGLMPMSLNRQTAAMELIKALAALVPGGSGELVAEIEASLLQLGDLAVPLRTEEGQPDVEGWKRWYEANRPYLVPGDAPYLHVGDEE